MAYKATYDKEAKALYIYVVAKEDRPANTVLHTEYDDPCDNMHFDWYQPEGKPFCTIAGVEILDVELEDITNKPVLPAITEMYS